MNSTSPRIQLLKEMLALEEQRGRVQQELNELTVKLNDMKSALLTADDLSASVTTPLTAPSFASSGSRRSLQQTPPGSLRAQIFNALKAAGEVGVYVKDVAAAIGTKPVNVHSWFHSNLAKFPVIQKVTGGHYRLTGELPEIPVKTAKPKPRKRDGRTQRGLLTEQILAELRAAEGRPITVGEIADKLGAKYKNIYIWFATTGKKFSGVVRTAPATFVYSENS